VELRPATIVLQVRDLGLEDFDSTWAKWSSEVELCHFQWTVTVWLDFFPESFLDSFTTRVFSCWIDFRHFSIL
jgi:hypothetical protein